MNPLKIRGITLKNNYILAPMAGYTDSAFRRLCAEYGAGLTVTEMISVKGLIHNGKKSEPMLKLSAAELPYASVQLFGGDPDAFARVVESPALDAFSLIDINMGCPVPKIVKNGEGSALMKSPEKAAALVRAVKGAAGKRAVTVKTRLGYHKDENTAAEFCLAMQEAGADMIALHGRTAYQKYAGEADWDAIAAVKEVLTIPLVGSGDIDLYNYKEREARVSGLMIGRGALGRPWLFAVMSGAFLSEPLKDVIVRHLTYMRDDFGSRFAAVNFRKHLSFYLSGVRGGKELKAKAFTLDDADEVIKLIGCAEALDGIMTDNANALFR